MIYTKDNPARVIYRGEAQGYGQLVPGMSGYAFYDMAAQSWSFRCSKAQGFGYAVRREQLIFNGGRNSS